MTFPFAELDARLDRRLPALVALRHDLHKHPELGFEEHRTQQVLHDALVADGYAPRAMASTGLVADLPGAGPGFVALRADIDCLPMPETTDLPYRSVHDGRAHKCGHDGHAATLLAVAHMLAPLRGKLPVGVRFLFQPAEEGVRGGGARVMVEAGALDGVTEVYGQHNWPPFPRGEVRVAGGPVMAAVDQIEIVVRGKGGHASQPQMCRDPIVGGAAIVTALQAVVSRGLGAAGGAVLTIASFRAGTTHNVIPPVAYLQGTMRTYDRALRDRLVERVTSAVAGAAAAHDVTAELTIQPEYPVLVNDGECAARVRRAAAAAGLPSTGDGLPLAAAEDFAYFAAARPSAFFFVGAGRPDGETPGCHHPDFDFDDALIPIGARVFVRIVADRCVEAAARRT